FDEGPLPAELGCHHLPGSVLANIVAERLKQRVRYGKFVRGDVVIENDRAVVLVLLEAADAAVHEFPRKKEYWVSQTKLQAVIIAGRSGKSSLFYDLVGRDAAAAINRAARVGMRSWPGRFVRIGGVPAQSAAP